MDKEYKINRDKSNITSSIEQINAQYGKLLPQAVEVEEAVLGALILSADAYDDVSNLISESSFYKEEHQKIFSHIKYLRDNNKPVDLIQVTQRLKDTDQLDKVGGPGYITQLLKNVAKATHIEHHARIIQQKFIQRELIRISSEIQTKAYDDTVDVVDMVGFANASISELALVQDESIRSPKQIVNDIYDRIKRNLDHTGNVTGFATGILKLDEFMSGFQKTDLTIIAAEPAQGKTSLLITIANNTSDLGNKIAIISIEMVSVQIFSRIISQETNLSSKDILMKKLSNKDISRIDDVRETVENKKIYADESSHQSLSNILGTIRRLHKKYGIEFFGIDYIQLIAIEGKFSQEERMAIIARSLKNIAKELDISVIALCQLSRGILRSDHRPTIERLRGSGQIGEAADNIIFIYRPEEYDIGFFDEEGYIPTGGKALIDIAKGRNIGTTQFVINFQKETGRFYENVVSNDDIEPDPEAFTESKGKDEPF